jgi:hypothetical protein
MLANRREPTTDFNAWAISVRKSASTDGSERNEVFFDLAGLVISSDASALESSMSASLNQLALS